MLPAAVVVGLAVIVAVIVIIFRERYHRKRRSALEAQLADLEKILLGLVNRPLPEPVIDAGRNTRPPASDTQSFCPRGPLSTAISVLKTDADVQLPGPDRTDLRATILVYENLQRPLTPGDVAEGLNLSLRSLQRGLGSSLGCTPTELILAVKMREAKRLLVEDEARVQEAARAVGYDDPFHFSRRFKSYYGVSPTEMQERLGRGAA
ncbi:MAG: AraC family transcriptional regulator [Thermoanaerobaculales bacterium]|jgi:AraC-like DNA-binding protein|nr:AraC family transcriptional regulator [Thermoanaerobaculales bacterium]